MLKSGDREKLFFFFFVYVCVKWQQRVSQAWLEQKSCPENMPKCMRMSAHLHECVALVDLTRAQKRKGFSSMVQEGGKYS